MNRLNATYECKDFFFLFFFFLFLLRLAVKKTSLKCRSNLRYLCIQGNFFPRIVCKRMGCTSIPNHLMLKEQLGRGFCSVPLRWSKALHVRLGEGIPSLSKWKWAALSYSPRRTRYSRPPPASIIGFQIFYELGGKAGAPARRNNNSGVIISLH